jgi:capsular polysaccharide transport system permease protein
MTIKPKALRFRVRKGVAAEIAAAETGSETRPETRPETGAEAAPPAPPPKPSATPVPPPPSTEDAPEDGFGDRVFPTAAAAADAPQPSARSAAELAANAAIEAEGLPPRQLRMARRVAFRNGIQVISDFDAVRILRDRGIEPFRRPANLQVVAGSQTAVPGAALASPPPGPAAPPLPAAANPAPKLPALDAPEERRAREIRRVQRDITRRRRVRLGLLFVRLAIFVFLPTFLAGYYFYVVATPMYGTRSEFLIQQASARGGSAGGIGSLFSGTALANSQDSITVQSYLQSREAMLRLDVEHGFKAIFADPALDPIQRLAADATNEEAYKTYTRNVKISYDPTEGLVRMEVSAPDPEVSAVLARALISYAEEQVDQLTQRLREDQMSGARENYERAEADMRAAQERVLDLQERRGVLSAEAEVSLLMGQISTFEGELRQERLDLEQLLDNPSPNAARVEATQRNIERLEGAVAEMRAQLTESGADTTSLARITGELLIAESDLEIRQMLLAQSLEQMEAARIEANRQVRYLLVGVSPVPPDEPTYPRAFENTAVAFLIFAGVYLMMSITASILREQVSA